MEELQGLRLGGREGGWDGGIAGIAAGSKQMCLDAVSSLTGCVCASRPPFPFITPHCASHPLHLAAAAATPPPPPPPTNREELGLGEELLRKVAANGCLKYPLPTLEVRVWVGCCSHVSTSHYGWAMRGILWTNRPICSPIATQTPTCHAHTHARMQERAAYWHQLGFSAAELRLLLDRMPRLLLYPLHEPKYQLKLRFLQGGWLNVGVGVWM